jgi:hypothetical protein
MRCKAVVGVLVVLAGCALDSGDDDGTAVSTLAKHYACQTVAAGQGFVSIPVDNATVLQSTTFTIEPSGTVDAVVGFSAGAPTGFASLATAFRLNGSGNVDARDGSTYRADQTYAYGTSVEARMIADLTTHTYSIALDTGDQYEIAHQYHFRTEQQSATHLDHLAIEVDSASGSVTVCPQAGASQGVAYSREGFYAAALQTGGAAVISDGATTLALDAHNHVRASITRGGTVAVDASGNVFLATLSGTTLSLEKLNASLVSQWKKTRTLPSGHTLVAVVADGSGGAALATQNQAAHTVYAFRFASDGAYLGSHGATGDVIALSPSAAFVGRYASGVLTLRKLSTTWATVWSKNFSGNALIDSIAAAPDGGVVFGGELSGPTNFGGSTLTPPRLSPEQTPNPGYVVRLAASGAHVFSELTNTGYIAGVATNGHWVVVSSTYYTQLHYPRLLFYSMTGEPASDAPTFDPGIGDENAHGEGRGIAISSDGHLLWQEVTSWPVVPQYPYLFAH